MNKEQFLAALRAKLTELPQADLERTLQYYREMIDDRIEEGMSEPAAVADVGDPDELAAAILQKPVKRTAVRERRPMSAGKKAGLIICAALLIIAGLALIIGSLNIRSDSDMKEYTFAGTDISALDIESGAADVKLLPTSELICRVRCVETPSLKYKVSLSSGTLHVERVSRWSLFPISLKEDRIEIYLPKQDHESLWIKSSSGGISVPADFRFDTAIVKASSGGIGFDAEVTDELNIQTSSGGVAVSGASPAELFVSVSSGGISLSDMSPGNAVVHASSGGIRLSGLRCGELSAETSSGSIRLSDVIASGMLTVKCSSGSVKLDDCDAADLYVKCTSGSVSGHLLTPKIYQAHSSSGTVRVPDSASGGICKIDTSSGSIHFD